MTKHFVEMSPEAVLNAIEGHEDILTPAFEKEQKRFSSVRCPECGCNAIMSVDKETPFVEGRPLPVYIPTCPKCNEPITSPSKE